MLQDVSPGREHWRGPGLPRKASQAHSRLMQERQQGQGDCPKYPSSFVEGLLPPDRTDALALYEKDGLLACVLFSSFQLFCLFLSLSSCFSFLLSISPAGIC